MKPPRKIVTRSPHRRVGYVPCPWLQSEHIAYESLLEASFIRIALLCPHVKEIRHQPFRLDLGSLGTYTPDYLLRCRPLENLVVEVKPSAHIAKHAAKLNAAKEILAQKGWEFIVCTELDIYGDDRGDRAGAILRYARAFVAPPSVSRLTERLASIEYPVTATALAQKLDTSLEQVLYLVGRRYFQLVPSLSLNELYYKENGEILHGNLSARAWVGGSAW